MIHTKDGRLQASPDTFQAQVQDGPRHNNNRCTGRWGWRDGKREDDGMYPDTSSSGVLKMRIPLCLSLGGFVEVGLGKGAELGSWSWMGSGLQKREDNEGTMRRLIYVRTLFLSSCFLLDLIRGNSLVARQLKLVVFVQPN